MRALLGLRRIFTAAFLATLACTADSAPLPPAPGTLVSSSQPRITVAAPAADLASAVASNVELGLDLKRVLVASAPQDNLVFSPYSVSAALAMAYGGSAGTTHDAFDRVLHLGLAEPAYHRAMNDLDRQLASRGQGAHGTAGQPFRLDVTNKLFADSQARFVPTYLDLLAQEYGAGVQLLELRTSPESSRIAINDWVDQKTGGYVKDLLAPGFLTSASRGVLVNAIYFNAAWAKRFETSRTSPGPFQLLDGTTAQAPMMRDPSLPTSSATVDGVEVVGLPYDGRELSLMVLMPTTGSFADWERSLTAIDIARYAAARRPETLALTIPKFTVRTSARLTGPLADLGLGIAFSDAANFTRMSVTEPLVITDVVHQAIIIVDESGTIAAAATGVGFGATSAPRPPRPVVIDRPFLYLLRDEATGAVLFLGRYVKP